MGLRVGIELTPVACRLVELEGPSLEPGRPLATRVRAYDVLPRSGPETVRRLAALGRCPAAVVVWGARSDHRQVVVSKGSYAKRRTEALSSARSAGVDTRGTIADVAIAPTSVKGAARQPVVLALANADAVSAAVRPLLDVGVRVHSVITPADALLGLARSRQAFSVPGGIEAYVALDETATCVALVRDGSLLSARELPWGFADGTGAPDRSEAEQVPRREDLAVRIVDELTEFLTAVGSDTSAVAQVSVCGGLAELRTMTVPLMERLDVEVEALDSLFGIDVASLPEPADEFREHAAGLRLAWAAGADWHGPIDLMRYRRHRSRRIVAARAAVFAGVAAGLGTGWVIQQSEWWNARATQTAAPSAAARTAPVFPQASSQVLAGGTTTPRPPRPPSLSTAPAAPPTSAPAAVGSVDAARSTETVSAPVPSQIVSLPAIPTPPAATSPIERVSTPATTPGASTPVPAKPSAVALPARTSPPPRPLSAIAAAPSRTAGGPAALQPAASMPRNATAPVPTRVLAEGGASVNRPAQRTAEEPPAPFDAVLGTILYSPDRKLAIVDGRIVGPGDAVSGARVVEITPSTVLLRDARGRLRSLTLGPVGQSGIAP